MTHPPLQRKWFREEMFHLLSISGNLSGFCVTAVALFRTLGKTSMSGTVADDMLACSALAFLICIHTVFSGLRRDTEIAAQFSEKLTDLPFTVGLAGVVAAGFVMAYTVW
jgi:hypothetical protein